MSGFFDDTPQCSGSSYGPIAPINTHTYLATIHTPQVLDGGSDTSYQPYTYTQPYSGEFDSSSRYEFYRQKFEAMGVHNGHSEAVSGGFEDVSDEEYEDDETVYTEDDGDDDVQLLNEYGKRHMLSLHSSKRSRLNENGDVYEIAPVQAPKQNQATLISQKSISEVPPPRLIKALPRPNGTTPNLPPPITPPPRPNTTNLTRTQEKAQESVRLLMRKASVSLTNRPNAGENIRRFISSLKRLPSEKAANGECASRMSRLERYRWLCEEEWATNVNRTYVNCVGCGRKVQLDKRADAEWYLSLWVKHRNKCHKTYEKWQRMQDAIEEQIEKENDQRELVVG
ncbi:hypothetical protein IW261DRAFT_902237 [Armillaria novae-zelandiae]|uniref:Uncharacterized protein n=1 Tax=Armillaria novae-zelandiae TaxID=153914 RepID=A0AA39NSZ5_9AGAR|nr:hypothetical protein IW261DRAFT_902237 [Armillaria novae-zelandiae]